MKLLHVESDGDKAQCVRLRGDRRSPEPTYFRVYLPFGDVTIVRTDGGEVEDEYWIHVTVNRPDDGGNPDRMFGRVKDGRADILGKHTADVDPAWLADPGLYHAAIRVGRATP